MAGSDKIKKDDVLGGLEGAVKSLVVAIGGAMTEIEGLIISQKKLAESINIGSSKELRELSQTLGGLTKLVKTHNELLKQQSVAEKKLVDIILQKAKVVKANEDAEIKAQKRKQEYLKTAAQESKSKVEHNKLLQQEQKEKERLAKIESKLVAEAKKLSSEYSKQSAHLNKIRTEYKDLNTKKQLNQVLTEKEIVQLNKLEKEVKELDAALKKVDADAGQFQRNVGNYTESLKDAIKETGAFGGALGDILGVLGKVKNRLDAAKESGKGFGKALAAGVALGAVAILAKALSTLSDISQRLTDIKEIALDLAKAKTFGAFGQGISVATKATDDYWKALIISREKLRDLSLEIQKAAQDQNDYNEIANDATLGFQTRSEFAKKAFEEEKKRATLSIEAANIELDVIEKKIKKDEALTGGGKALNDLYEQRTQIQLKLGVAQDEFNDALRLSQTLEREIQEKHLKQTVNIIQAETELKLKQLQNDLANQRKQLDERRKIVAESNEVSRQAFNKEIKQFNEILGIQIEGYKLLKITDGELLEAEIDRLNLGVKAQKELFDVIQTRQKAKIELAQEIAKLDEEEIKRTQRLAEIEREISVIKKNQEISLIEKQLDEQKKAEEQLQEDLLKEDNAFNKQKLKRRNEFIKQEDKLQQELTDKNLSLIDLERKKEIEKAQNTITDKLILEKEIEKINIDYAGRAAKLQNDNFELTQDLNEKRLKDEKEIRDKQIKTIAETAQFISKELEKAYTEAAAKREEDLDNQIDRRKDNIDKQRELAEKGANNDLAFQESQLAKEELLKVEQQRKDEFNKKIIAYWNLLASYAEQNPETALAKTLKTIGIAEGAKALFSASQGFFEGTEKVENDLHGNSNVKDGYDIRVDGQERILTGEQNKLVGNITNKDLANLAYNWRTGVLHSEVGQESFSQNIGASIDMMRYATMIDKKLDKFVAAVQNIEPTHVHLDNLGQVITEKVRNGIMKREINVQSKSFR